MYLELQAEGWKELSWCGPVQIMLQASVAEVILDAQQLLMNLAREAPDSTMPMNSFPKLSMRFQFSFKSLSWFPLFCVSCIWWEMNLSVIWEL